MREGGPQHHEAEDEPDVVGLPDRADGVRGDGPRPRAASRATGDEVPEPGAEVRPAEDGVGGHADEQHDGDRGAHPTGTFSAGGGIGSRGP